MSGAGRDRPDRRCSSHAGHRAPLAPWNPTTWLMARLAPSARPDNRRLSTVDLDPSRCAQGCLANGAACFDQARRRLDPGEGRLDSAIFGPNMGSSRRTGQGRAADLSPAAVRRRAMPAPAPRPNDIRHRPRLPVGRIVSPRAARSTFRAQRWSALTRSKREGSLPLSSASPTACRYCPVASASVRASSVLPMPGDPWIRMLIPHVCACDAPRRSRTRYATSATCAKSPGPSFARQRVPTNESSIAPSCAGPCTAPDRAGVPGSEDVDLDFARSVGTEAGKAKPKNRALPDDAVGLVQLGQSVRQAKRMRSHLLERSLFRPADRQEAAPASALAVKPQLSTHQARQACADRETKARSAELGSMPASA